MDKEQKEILSKVANAIRDLSMDAVQKANSGHPGLPLGCAELGAYLWGHAMRYNPKNIHWPGRDRFVLSAGHGCMLQYSCLHLSGYDISLDDIKQFRQLHSITPGHPEYGETPGIEVITGPLGQGVANAAGMALGLKIVGQKFHTDKHQLFNNKVFCLAGDGCMMEGVASEASSLAGHLMLDNLILLYDSNKICLDGPTSECFSEDTKARYRSYGFEVYEIDGYDFDAMDEVITQLRENQKKPAFIEVHTVIGKGSPHKAGTNKAHGSPLGEEEVKLTKDVLGIPQEDFFVPQAVKNFFAQRLKKCQAWETQWNDELEAWSRENPKMREDYNTMRVRGLPDDLEQQIKEVEITSPVAGRSASHAVLQKLGSIAPQLYGGSADLSGSDKTMMEAYPLIAPGVFSGRNIKYGVREFGMAAMANGLSRVGFITPYIGTFFTFSDYMRNAIRLACIGKHKVMYQFTHDSIFLGEDGPTHQSVEQLMSLRAIPHLHLYRPGDANEVKMAWIAMVKYWGPSAIILSRQKLPEVPGTDRPYAEGVGRGAYIVRKEKSGPDYTLIGTGSELHLAHNVAIELEKMGKGVRVISMPCWELFDQQDQAYQDSVLGGDLGQRVSIEAGVDQGWYKYIGHDGIAISINRFGASAPASALAKEYGFTVEDILESILR